MLESFGETIDSGHLIDDRYRYIRRLGSGSTGEVVLAEDTQLNNQYVALKILYPHLLLDKEHFSRYRSETLITMKLAHTNVLQTYGMGTHDDGLGYLVLEYVDGLTLESLLSEHGGAPIEFCEVARIAYEICLGLREAHRAGIVHRDIKPGNILLTETGVVKVADFGLAQVVRADRGAGNRMTVLGTPYYMSPEQVRCEFTDVRTDIYSLGILLFELATASRPFRANTFVALAEKHLHEPLPSACRVNPQVPLWFDSFLATACAKDARERFSTMDEVIRELVLRLEGTDVIDTDQLTPESNLSVRASQEMAVQKNYFLQRKGTFLQQLFMLGFVVLLVVLGPNLHESWERRYAAKILSAEVQFGWDLSVLRWLFGIRVSPDDAHLLAEARTKEIIWPLLEAGISPNIYSEVKGEYPLHHWAKTAHKMNLQKFLKHGADVTLKDSEGRTPLYLGVLYNSVVSVAEILAAGADPNTMARDGVGALHIAAQLKSPDVLSLLLQYGADPNILDGQGNAPVHYAARNGNEVNLRLLERNGADFSLRDSKGRTVGELREIRRRIVAISESRAILPKGPRS